MFLPTAPQLPQAKQEKGQRTEKGESAELGAPDPLSHGTPSVLCPLHSGIVQTG